MEFRKNTRRGNRLWRALERAGEWEDRPLMYRGSSLPFCPRAYFLDRIMKPPVRRNYSSDVRLWRGHAIHNCIQHWLGQAGMLFGNWECYVCKVTLGPNYVIRDEMGPPGVCPRHGVTLRYQEYELEYEGLHGHPDGLISETGAPEEGFDLLEAKTIQHTAFRGSTYGSFLDLKEPLPNHVEQANAYACMIPKVLGFKINKVLIVYLSADKPNWKPKTYEFTPDETRFRAVLDTLHQIDERPLDARVPPCPEDTRSPFCRFADAGFCSMRRSQLEPRLKEYRRDTDG